MIPNPDGGSFVFEFMSAFDILEVSLLSVVDGGEVVFVMEDGSSETIEIPSMAENSVLHLLSGDGNMEDVETMTVTFNGLGAITNVGVCGEFDKINPAPPTGTGEPTPAPTSTPSPTEYEHECPEDIVLLVPDDIEDAYPDVPIIILEQGTTYLKFGVKNVYNSTVSNVFTQFHDKPTGETDCYETTQLMTEEYVEYTAYCMHNVALTIVDVWVVGQPYNSSAEVPECCHPPDDMEDTKIQYSFKIYCETKCPPEEDAPTGARRLEGNGLASMPAEALREQVADVASVYEPSSDKKSDHFCTAEDYPCGDNGDLVHVCHYSAKDGYQTFCVPESDSDVLMYYKKDYCGPCVGGYATH